MISSKTQRILYRDTAVNPLVDASTDLNNFLSGSVDLTLADDGYLYIGQYLPFTSRYLDLGASLNTTAAVLSVEYWDGSNWILAVDIRDETTSAGLPLAKSGYLTWEVDRDESTWSCEDESKDVIGLESGPQIYDYYWLRISTSVTLDVVTIKHIGNLFSTDAELYSQYPTLDSQTTRDQWTIPAKGTKLNWLDQGFIASEMIVRELKTRNIILEEGQILDATKLNSPAIHKQAATIYSGMGRSFADLMTKAEKKSKDDLKLGRLNIDTDGNAGLSGQERQNRTEFATR